MDSSQKNINTGKMLNEYMEKNFITRANLGRKIGRLAISISQYTQRDSIQTNTLLMISHALKHNFFRDIADLLPQTYSRTKPEDLTLLNEKDQQIAQLQEENKVLKIQNDLLMKIKL